METEKTVNNEEIKEETAENGEEISTGKTSAAETEAEKNAEAEEADGKENRGSRKEKKLSHQLQKEVDSLKERLAEKNDQYLRLAAEYDNYRKRTDKEKGDCYVSAYGDALKAFLPLLDVLYQAQQYTPDDAGIQALVKQAEDILSKLNIRAMETDGATFDPVFHNAVMHEDNPDAGENTIVQTFQRGYMLGDRVLRPAMVKVAN